ncbi:MAG: YcbK family protein, partial [bacterium]
MKDKINYEWNKIINLIEKCCAKCMKNQLNEELINEVKDNLERLALFLEQVRKVVNKPISISSGYRSKEVNESVGGSKTSQHCEGCAADFNVKGMSPDAVVRA